MAKFVLNDLKSKASAVIKERRFKAILQAKSMMGTTNEVFYSAYFHGINGFVRGNPTFVEVECLKWLHAGIDEQYNKESKERVAEILSNWKKQKIVRREDRGFLEMEVRPYVTDSLNKTKGLSMEMIQAVDEGRIKEWLKKAKKEKVGRYK